MNFLANFLLALGLLLMGMLVAFMWIAGMVFLGSEIHPMVGVIIGVAVPFAALIAIDL